MPLLREIIDVLDEWFPPADADSWDAVGLVVGAGDDPVARILLAIDAVPATVAEAERSGAQLLFTHHPLLLTAVHSVTGDEPKGALIHRLIRSSIAHFVAHSNAEVARPGVSDGLADALGLQDVEPLEPIRPATVDDVAKLVVFVPVADASRLLDALTSAGAGALGSYDRCAWWTQGIGTFRPGPDADPAVGTRGEIAELDEVRLEMIVARKRWPAVLTALRATHPYEEPAFDLLARLPDADDRGVGRIGMLATPLTLAAFAELVSRAVPATLGGVRAAGDPDQPVRRVAVLAGSGSSLVELARRRGADAYVTSDLKHHHALEAVTQRAGHPMALVDVSHWAAERPWLDGLALRLRERFGATVEVVVSDLVTDPWTLVRPPDPESRPPTPW